MVKVVSQIIFPLITFPYISRVFHADAVGAVNYASSVYSYISLIASLSITTYAVRECSVRIYDRLELSSTASELFSINIYSTILAYAVMLVILCIPQFRNIKSLIAINCINLIFTTLGTDWINSALEDFRFITLRTVAFQCVSLILMFIFVHGPKDYVKYVMITVIASSGANVTNIFYRTRYCTIKFVRNPNFKKHLPKILKFFSAVVTQQIYVNSDVVMLGWMTNTTQVGLYSTALKIFNLVNTMIASIFTVVLPQACSTYENGNYQRYNEVLRNVILYLIGLGFPCVIGMLLLSRDIIIFIAGEEYASAAPALMYFAGALLFSCFHGFLGNLITIPMGDFNIGIIAALISSLANIVLNAILIPHFGFVAAAFTTMLAELISALVFTKKINNYINIQNVNRSVFHSAMGCLTFTAFIIVMKRLKLGNFVGTILMITGSVVIYGIVLLLFKDEFALQALNILRKRRRANENS
jgi:O-antigen/teichoic acid export membrane protein